MTQDTVLRFLPPFLLQEKHVDSGVRILKKHLAAAQKQAKAEKKKAVTALERHSSIANGKTNGMKLRIDRSGRIVVPKPLRKRLGLHPDQELELVEQSNGVLLRPVRQEPSLVKVGVSWFTRGLLNRMSTGTG